jgi:diguanylate cyclase (GGDEF)-like protein
MELAHLDCVMRLIARTDTPLAAGLVIGALILFHQPLRWALDWAGNIESDYHLDLVPALVVLTALFAFHQLRKRRQSQAEALAVAAEARQHLERTRELEALVDFGRTLASALDVEGLRHAVSRCLPRFAGDSGLWVLVTRQGVWHTLAIDPITEQEFSRDDLEQAATRTLLARMADAAAHSEGVLIDGFLCFPLAVGTTIVGAMGVRQGATALDDSARRALGVAASLLSIAVRNVHLMVETRDVSVHDPLTGCLNRKPGIEALDAELRRAKRSSQPLSVLMLDVDRFKDINDAYGHQAGDLVLATIGRRLLHTLRGSDVKCRYGGDEFILILPDTPIQGAQQVANGLRKEIMHAIEDGGHTLSCTVSIGITSVEPGETDVKALIDRADQALYRAKKAGRNCSRAGLETASSAPSLADAPPPAADAPYAAHDLELTA